MYSSVGKWVVSGIFQRRYIIKLYIYSLRIKDLGVQTYIHLVALLLLSYRCLANVNFCGSSSQRHGLGKSAVHLPFYQMRISINAKAKRKSKKKKKNKKAMPK